MTGNSMFPGGGTFCELFCDGGLESSVTRTAIPRSPYVFSFPKQQDVEEITEILRAANPDVFIENITENVLSVVLPPSIKVGTDPVSLKKLTFALMADRAVRELQLSGEMEICCGDGNGACCAN